MWNKTKKVLNKLIVQRRKIKIKIPLQKIDKFLDSPMKYLNKTFLNIFKIECIKVLTIDGYKGLSKIFEDNDLAEMMQIDYLYLPYFEGRDDMITVSNFKIYQKENNKLEKQLKGFIIKLIINLNSYLLNYKLI